MLKISNSTTISHTIEELSETVINAVVRIPRDKDLLLSINPFVNDIKEYLKRRDDDTKELFIHLSGFYWNTIDRGASKFVVISEYSNPNYLTPENTPIDICFLTNNNITGMHSEICGDKQRIQLVDCKFFKEIPRMTGRPHKTLINVFDSNDEVVAMMYIYKLFDNDKTDIGISTTFMKC